MLNFKIFFSTGWISLEKYSDIDTNDVILNLKPIKYFRIVYKQKWSEQERRDNASVESIQTFIIKLTLNNSKVLFWLYLYLTLNRV